MHWSGIILTAFSVSKAILKIRPLFTDGFKISMYPQNKTPVSTSSSTKTLNNLFSFQRKIATTKYAVKTFVAFHLVILQVPCKPDVPYPPSKKFSSPLAALVSAQLAYEMDHYKELCSGALQSTVMFLSLWLLPLTSFIYRFSVPTN